MQTNNNNTANTTTNTSNSAAQAAATVANAIKAEAAKQFGEAAAAKLVVGTVPAPNAEPQQQPEPQQNPEAQPKAEAKQNPEAQPKPEANPKTETPEKPKRTRKTAAPQTSDKKPALSLLDQQQRAERMQRELQATLQRLNALQELNRKRTKFLETLDLLADAEQRLSAEEVFEVKNYKIEFCGGKEYRPDTLFSIANRELLLDFVGFMQARIRERVSLLEEQIIEI